MVRCFAVMCHGADLIVHVCGAGVGSLFCGWHMGRHYSGGTFGKCYSLSWAVYTGTAEWQSNKMYLWVGGSVVSGSGKRGQDAGTRLSVSLGTCARSYWPLDFTKPKTGRHGARGAGWRNKCPFWMSSTQWGVVETVWAEGAVAGSMWAALATLLLCLWACPYGNRGLTFCKQAGAQEQIDLHSRALLEVNFVILLPSTQY